MKKSSAKDNGPKIARVYIRVSHQGDRGKGPGTGEFVSPDMQLAEAKQYAKIHLKDYEFDEEASRRNADIDRSASRIKWQKRAGLVSHLEAAQRGEFDTLIVFKLSRFARNAKEGLELFDLFEDAHCSIHCIKEQIDTSTATGKMLRTMLLALAEMEAENISDFVKASVRARVAKGLPHGTPPFWITKNGGSEFVLNERQQDIRRLVELRIAGVSYTSITRKLNTEGVRTADGLKWTSQRVRSYFMPERIQLMLGHHILGVDKDENDPDRMVIENAYPAVITEDEADSILAMNRRMTEMYGYKGPRRAANTTYILSGLIHCSACNSRMRSRNSYPKGGEPPQSDKMPWSLGDAENAASRWYSKSACADV